MRKRLLVLLAAMAMAVGLAVAVAPTPAMANPAGCPEGHACLWINSNYSGSMLDIPFSQYYHNGQCNYLNQIYPFWFSSLTTSVYNDFGNNYRLLLWYGPQCHSSSLLVTYAQNGWDLTGSGWDNHVFAFTIQPL